MGVERLRHLRRARLLGLTIIGGVVLALLAVEESNQNVPTSRSAGAQSDNPHHRDCAAVLQSDTGASHHLVRSLKQGANVTVGVCK